MSSKCKILEHFINSTPGLNKFLTPYHIKSQNAPISLKTVFAPFPSAHLQKLAEVPSWTPIRALPKLSLDPLPAPSAVWSPRVLGTMTWINSSGLIIITFITLTVIIGFKLCKRYRPLPWLLRRKSPSAPIDMELHPRSVPTEEPTPNLRLPLYPDLGRDAPQVNTQLVNN